MVLIAASGVLHAVQTGAWSKDQLLRTSANRLQQLPLSIGSWRGKESAVDPRQLKVAQAAGATFRTYHSDNTSLNTMLLCGPSGPIAVHPPTICFTAAGYAQVTPQRRVDVRTPDGKHLGSFWTADFEWKNDNGLTSRIRTYWSWSNGSGWKAPAYPRYEFAGSHVLHKLYVTRQLEGEQAEAEPIIAFLQQLLPAANRALFEVET